MSISRKSSGCTSSFLNFDELVQKALQPGDLIEIDRGNYNHWAFYAGQCENGTHWCFHVTTDVDGDFNTKDALMSDKAAASVKKHKLKDILSDNDKKKPSMARVNNKISEAKRKNCVPLEIAPVLEDLEKRKDLPIPYDLADSNCEHHVTTWRYGTGWSDQVEIVETAVITAIAAALFGPVFGVGALIVSFFRKPNENKKDAKN